MDVVEMGCISCVGKGKRRMGVGGIVIVEDEGVAVGWKVVVGYNDLEK
jgi:hypothetical protein